MKQGYKITRFVISLFVVLVLFAGICPSYAHANIRVGILNFINRTNDSRAEEYMREAADILAKHLSANSSIAVIGREQLSRNQSENDSSKMTDARQIADAGRKAGCDYMVIAAITGGDSRTAQKSSGGGLGLLFGGKVTLENHMEFDLTVNARVVDVKTGEVALSVAKQGTGIYIGTESYGMSDKEVKEHMERAYKTGHDMWIQAMTNSSAQVAEKICEYLTGDHAKVMAISGKSVTINRGSANGITSDDMFRVYEEGEEVIDLDGKSLGKDSRDVALLVVDKANIADASLHVVAGDALSIREGSKVELISLADANVLLEKPAFNK